MIPAPDPIFVHQLAGPGVIDLAVLGQQMNNFPWPRLIVGVLFVGFWLFSFISKYLQQQAELRRREAARQQQEREVLRTGREPAASDPGGRPITQESPGARRGNLDAAALREARLRELKRRQQALASRGAGAAGAPPTAPQPTAQAPSGGPIDINLGGVILRIPGSTGPTVPGTRQPGARPPARKPQQRTAASPRAGDRDRRSMTPEQAADSRRRQAQKKAYEARQTALAQQQAAEVERREAAARRAARARREELSSQDTPRRLVPSDPEAPLALSPAAITATQVRTALHDPASVRQALILREILGPPISLR